MVFIEEVDETVEEVDETSSIKDGLHKDSDAVKIDEDKASMSVDENDDASWEWWKWNNEKEKVKKKKKLKKGFLNKEKGEALYPKGSRQGKVSEKQKKWWAEYEMNKKMNKNLGFGQENTLKPDWYSSEYPSGCQYNNPECKMDKLKKSDHKTDLHKKMVQDSNRWKAMLETFGVNQTSSTRWRW